MTAIVAICLCLAFLGRCRAGFAWRMYTEDFFDATMEDYSTPEIRRVPLEEIVLQVLLLRLGLPEVFLAKTIQPPSMEQVRRSVHTLLEIKAILPQPELPLTALGFHLAKLPVDVRLGKLMIVGALLNCIEPVLTIAASLGGKNPFVSPPNKRDQARAAHRRFKIEKCSDHLAIVSAYTQWRSVKECEGKEAASAFCFENYLSTNALAEIHILREHFRRYLVESGFLHMSVTERASTEQASDDGFDKRGLDGSSQPLPPLTSVETELVRCALTAGMYPQIIRATRGSMKASTANQKGHFPITLLQPDNQEVFIHPMSLTGSDLPNIFEDTIQGGITKDAYIVYYTKVASNKLYLHDCSSVPLPAVLLFGGDIAISKNRERIMVDGWIQLKTSELHAVLYKRLQREIEGLLICKVEDPFANITQRQACLAKVISLLLMKKP